MVTDLVLDNCSRDSITWNKIRILDRHVSSFIKVKVWYVGGRWAKLGLRLNYAE